MRKCPHCLKKISETARKCKFCGEWVVEKDIDKKETKFSSKETGKEGKDGEKTIIRVGPSNGTIILIILIILGLYFALLILSD